MTEGSGSARYAIYFAPEVHTPLHRFGSRWLGRDAATGATLDQPVVPGLSAGRLAEVTRSAAHYGFHATLKPPFRLADGCEEAGLLEQAARLAAERSPFDAPPLMLTVIDGWRALVLADPCPRTQALCDELVAALDAFRAPPSAGETARRKAAGLSVRQQALLQRWGYPYVFDEFRFHMTLTARLGDEEGALVDAALKPMAAEHCAAPLVVDALAVFRQSGDGPFRMIHRFPFGERL